MTPPTARPTRRVAWAVGALVVIPAAVVLTAVVLRLTAGDYSIDDAGFALGFCLVTAAFAVTGALVARRQPANPIGWLFLVVGVLACGLLLSDALQVRYLPPGETRSMTGRAAGWYEEWFWAPMMVGSVLTLPLTFPDGKLPSRHWVWRATAVAATVGLCALTAFAAFGTSSLTGRPQVANPLYFSGARFFNWLTPLLAPAGVGALAALGVRFRRATGVERAQLRWFVLAIGALAATFAVNLVFASWGILGVLPEPIANGSLVSALALIPVATGVAMLRYRLYEIDRLISRTVSYAVLTGLLAVPYLVIVSAVSRLLSGSSVGVAAATLTVAALFNPVRRRVQSAVDRRFNRSRYDAARTVEAFSARLRDDVDLESLRAELLAVVQHTMQPATVSVWLRPAPAHGPRTP